MSLDVTVTDLFCGAGGSSIGAEAAGARLRMAANHWRLASRDAQRELSGRRPRQYGNAVTPPMMTTILGRAIPGVFG